mgnify:CR=1 FL=1
MTIPRSERLRITQQVYKQWQEIYGDREDSEAESANWDMLNKAMAEADVKVDEIIRNTYRTLMTRGMKGCYVYFEDKKTAEYFKKLIPAN